MSEPRHCPDCGALELSRHSYEECCAMLKEQRDLATARAEEAEAELDEARRDAVQSKDTVYVWTRSYEYDVTAQSKRAEMAEAENDALRKDAARLRGSDGHDVRAFMVLDQHNTVLDASDNEDDAKHAAWIGVDPDDDDAQTARVVECYLVPCDAALAVQP